MLFRSPAASATASLLHGANVSSSTRSRYVPGARPPNTKSPFGSLTARRSMPAALVMTKVTLPCGDPEGARTVPVNVARVPCACAVLAQITKNNHEDHEGHEEDLLYKKSSS